jgi:hypothetical protein
VGREEQLAVGAVEVDLGFEHPGEGRWHRDEAGGVGLAVVGLRSFEDLALVGGTAGSSRRLRSAYSWLLLITSPPS